MSIAEDYKPELPTKLCIIDTLQNRKGILLC